MEPCFRLGPGSTTGSGNFGGEEYLGMARLPMVYILNILNVLYKAAGTTRPFASISFLLAFHSVYVPYLMLFPRYSKTLTCTDLNQPIHIRFLVLVLNYFFAFYSKS